MPKDSDKNLNHEIEFIIKQNESFAEHQIKNEIDQLLSKYKHGSDIREHNSSKTKTCGPISDNTIKTIYSK